MSARDEKQGQSLFSRLWTSCHTFGTRIGTRKIAAAGGVLLTPMRRTRPLTLVAALAAAFALAASAHAASPYPTTPVFDPLPASVVPNATGYVTVGWTSTFLWGSSFFNPRYLLTIDSDPLPPYATTTESRTIAVLPPAIRNYEGPFTSHQTWRVAARLPGRYTVRVQAAESVKPMGALASAWAARAFDVEPVFTQG
jgi:hypothetical protein